METSPLIVGLVWDIQMLKYEQVPRTIFNLKTARHLTYKQIAAYFQMHLSHIFNKSVFLLTKLLFSLSVANNYKFIAAKILGLYCR